VRELNSNMHWVYVLSCVGRGYYIGETTSLRETLRNHFHGKGTLFTRMYPPVCVMGLYHVKNNVFFHDHDVFQHDVNEPDPLNALWLEQLVTKQLMCTFNGSVFWSHAKEGLEPAVRTLSDPERPLCNCGLPCEIYSEGDASFWYGCPALSKDRILKTFGIPYHDACEFVFLTEPGQNTKPHKSPNLSSLLKKCLFG
jgi:hypothetical protein